MSNTTENRLFSFIIIIIFFFGFVSNSDNAAVGGGGTVICQMPKYLSEFSRLTRINT